MTAPTDELTARVAHIRERMARACDRVGRDPAEVTLVAVAKGHTPEAVARVVELGVVDIGESYVQEFAARLEALDEATAALARWHFIGHLQRNKARHLAAGPPLCRLHSLDSERLAVALDRRFDAPLDVMIEVNLAAEDSKAGVGVDAARRVLEAADEAANLRPVGLMCIPPDVDTPEQARPWFVRLRELRDRLNVGRPATARLTELSMGMSHDFEVAIEEGATWVRVGTALFGPRTD